LLTDGGYGRKWWGLAREWSSFNTGLRDLISEAKFSEMRVHGTISASPSSSRLSSLGISARSVCALLGATGSQQLLAKTLSSGFAVAVARHAGRLDAGWTARLSAGGPHYEASERIKE
jgi:hypothetical protein